MMGDSENEGTLDELPTHKVFVNSFYLSAFEITQVQYRALMNRNPSTFKNCLKCPVETISFFDALQFCNRLSVKEGRKPVYILLARGEVLRDSLANGYRLPTESEFEYAAGGYVGSRTKFGNGRDTLRATEVNFDASELHKQRYSEVGVFRNKTVPVGSFIPNAFGLYDMVGNVSEWCFDYYGSYSIVPKTNPSGPTTGRFRILRGGSWNSPPYDIRVVDRDAGNPDHFISTFGFRVALNAPR